MTGLAAASLPDVLRASLRFPTPQENAWQTSSVREATIDLLTHLALFWLNDWSIVSLIDWSIDRWIIDWWMDWLIDPLIDWLIVSLIDWLIDRLIDCFIDWLNGDLSVDFKHLFRLFFRLVMLWEVLIFSSFFLFIFPLEKWFCQSRRSYDCQVKQRTLRSLLAP